MGIRNIKLPDMRPALIKYLFACMDKMADYGRGTFVAEGDQDVNDKLLDQDD